MVWNNSTQIRQIIDNAIEISPQIFNLNMINFF
jgi:hypothetical protein